MEFSLLLQSPSNETFLIIEKVKYLVIVRVRKPLIFFSEFLPSQPASQTWAER